MTASEARRDKHFPTLALDNPLRRLFGDPHKYCAYVEPGQTVADLGCGPGFHVFALAERVGPGGRVYAVDSDRRAIRAVVRKAARRGTANVEAHLGSAADLSFIEDASVDFVLADGLLCSMAPQDHESALREIKRVLKPGCKAYLQVAKGRMSYVDAAEWEAILEAFDVERRNAEAYFEDRWAVVSRRHP